jgi:hypothetical protein
VSKSSKRGRSQFDQALGPESATVDGKIGGWSVPLTTSGEGGRVLCTKTSFLERSVVIR